MNRAFILHIRPSGQDRVPEALEESEIIIGWSDAKGLRDPNLGWNEFRQILYDTYHPEDETYRRAGASAGHMWRFTRSISVGDLVVVPYGKNFLVARVEGEVQYREDKAPEDTAYRRKVTWLTGNEGIPRRFARAPLQARMKIRGVSADATDLLDDIQEALQLSEAGESPTFEEDLRLKLVEQTRHEIQYGRIENFGFERLVANVVSSLGASVVNVLSRAHADKGADILATFMVAQTFEFTIAIQAKHFRPAPPVEPEVVDQLVAGMEAEGTHLGWIVTSGTFSDETSDYKAHIEGELGYQIELVDGEQLSAMIVEGGLRDVGDISCSV